MLRFATIVSATNGYVVSRSVFEPCMKKRIMLTKKKTIFVIGIATINDGRLPNESEKTLDKR